MAKKSEPVTAPCIDITQSSRSFLMTRLSARVLTEISYASVFRRDEEEGAVQRLLDTSRIAEVRDYTLAGGDYPGCIILNWVSRENPLTVADGVLSFVPAPRIAQLVDGQHRAEGLRSAIKQKSSAGDIQLPVAIYQGLTTQECADIFISINHKQRKVPPSLVADLYGVASKHIVDPVAQRARDIAELMNTEDQSPYRGYIRLANAPAGQFGISLSTVVATIKPIVEPQGLFESVGLSELHMQKTALPGFSWVD